MKAIQKKITIMIWICSILITILAIESNFGLDAIKAITIAMFSISIISTILYFLPIRERLKAIIVLLLVGMGCYGASITMGGNSGTFITSFLVLGMAALYFDPVILLGYSSFYTLISIVFYIVKPEYIIGFAVSRSTGALEIFTFAAMSVCLYIVTKAGRNIMQKANHEENEAVEKSMTVEKMTESAQKNALSLFENISVADQNVNQLSKDANHVNSNIIELKDSEAKTMQEFDAVSGKIALSTQWIEDNCQLVNELNENFMNALENVKEGMTYSQNTSHVLDDIKLTIQSAQECIAKSSQEIKQINDIIKDIDDIASRTNLLAINASIEAARVGNNGQGFNIVAEQIRVLSSQSRQASDNIRTILSMLSLALAGTGSKIENGSTATMQGIANLDSIVDGLKAINLYSTQAQSALNMETEVFEKIKEDFASMVSEVNKSVAYAKDNMKEIQTVADAVQSQTGRTLLIADQLKDMESLASEIKNHFSTEKQQAV